MAACLLHKIAELEALEEFSGRDHGRFTRLHLFASAGGRTALESLVRSRLGTGWPGNFWSPDALVYMDLDRIESESDFDATGIIAACGTKQLLELCWRWGASGGSGCGSDGQGWAVRRWPARRPMRQSRVEWPVRGTRPRHWPVHCVGSRGGRRSAEENGVTSRHRSSLHQLERCEMEICAELLPVWRRAPVSGRARLSAAAAARNSGGQESVWLPCCCCCSTQCCGRPASALSSLTRTRAWRVA